MTAMTALRLIALTALFYASSTLPEIEDDVTWQFEDQLYRVPFQPELFGAPCTLKTDIEEHTCNLTINWLTPNT